MAHDTCQHPEVACARDGHIDDSVRPELYRVHTFIGPIMEEIPFHLDGEKGCLGRERVGISTLNEMPPKL